MVQAGVSVSERDDFITTTPQWFDLWLKHFGTENAGIWPAPGEGAGRVPYVRERLHIGPVGIRVASGAANSHTARYDALEGPLSVAALEAMMRDLDVDMLRFDFLSEQSKLLRLARAAGRSATFDVDDCQQAPYVDCSGTWEDYWLSRGSSRKSWANRENKLLKQMKASVRCLTRWDEVENELESILRIEASGWKGEKGSSIVQSDAALAFYTELTRCWADACVLRLFVLDLDGKPVAFELNALHGDRLNIFKHGYDEELAKLGAGSVLRVQVLKWAFAQPEVRCVDMFGPSTEAKMKWATGVADLYTLRAFRASARGQLCRLRYSVAPRIKARIASRRQDLAPVQVQPASD